MCYCIVYHIRFNELFLNSALCTHDFLPLLSQPTMITDFVRSSFSYSAPAIWNDLPAEILFSDSESGFQ